MTPCNSADWSIYLFTVSFIIFALTIGFFIYYIITVLVDAHQKTKFNDLTQNTDPDTKDES